MSTVTEVQFGADRASVVQTLREALGRAEAGEFIRVAVVGVCPGGDVAQIWSAGRNRFTLVGGLIGTAMAITNQGD